jgi:hypothetical protein
MDSRDSAHASLLAGHFFRRFLENDLVSPDGDGRENVTAVFAFLALPGLWVSMGHLFGFVSPVVTPSELLLRALHNKFEFLACSMIVMALVTVLQWDALALDARDYAVFGPLPVSRAVLMRAKVQALFLFALSFAVAVNAIPTLLFPLALLANLQVAALRGIWLAVVHAGVSIAASLFAFFVVLGLRSLLAVALGPRAFRRISMLVQSAAVVGLVTAFLLLPALGSGFSRTRPIAGSAALYLSPPAWFVGLYETVTALVLFSDPKFLARSWRSLWRMEEEADNHAIYLADRPVLHNLGLAAIAGFVTAWGVALFFFSRAHRRHLSDLRDVSAWGPSRARARLQAIGRYLAGAVVRRPEARATFFFTLNALARSARHRLSVAAYVAVGFALAVVGVTGVVGRSGLHGLFDPAPGLLAVQLILSFFLLVGVRAALEVPAELKSNWVFRLTGGDTTVDLLAGARRAVAFGIALPFAAAFLPVQAALWGPRVGLLHFVCALLLSLALVEVLFLGFRKVPFTCGYLAGKANVKVLWPVYLLSFALYTYGFANLEAWAFRSDTRVVTLVAVQAGVLLVATGRRRLTRQKRQPLQFEDLPEPATQALGLSA